MNATIDLKKAKEGLVKNWEEAMKPAKIEDCLNKAGVEKFWSDDTSYNEGFQLLIFAAANELMHGMVHDMLGDVAMAVVKVSHGEGPGSEAQPVSFKIYKESSGSPNKAYFLKEEFDTYGEADDFRHKYALESRNRLDELKIVKVFGHEADH